MRLENKEYLKCDNLTSIANSIQLDLTAFVCALGNFWSFWISYLISLVTHLVIIVVVLVVGRPSSKKLKLGSKHVLLIVMCFLLERHSPKKPKAPPSFRWQPGVGYSG